MSFSCFRTPFFCFRTSFTWFLGGDFDPGRPRTEEFVKGICSCPCPRTEGHRDKKFFLSRDKGTTGRPVPVCPGTSRGTSRPLETLIQAHTGKLLNIISSQFRNACWVKWHSQIIHSLTTFNKWWGHHHHTFKKEYCHWQVYDFRNWTVHKAVF